LGLAEAHTSLAYGKMHFEWDWAGADARLQHAHDINPNYPTLNHWQSHYMMATGDTAGALAASKKYLELDPLDSLANIYTKLNTYVRYPAWSPLRNQIAYEYAETTGNIWLMDLK
jgi:lipoprotein NlpI